MRKKQEKFSHGTLAMPGILEVLCVNQTHSSNHQVFLSVRSYTTHFSYIVRRINFSVPNLDICHAFGQASKKKERLKTARRTKTIKEKSPH